MSTLSAIRRVLLVEDQPEFALTMMSILKSLHHEVVLAVDAASALAEASAFKPEVVLLDVELPDQSGHEVARQLRAGEGGRAMVIVMLSGWSTPAIQATARAAGADRYLVKPAKLGDLRAVLAMTR